MLDVTLNTDNKKKQAYFFFSEIIPLILSSEFKCTYIDQHLICSVSFSYNNGSYACNKNSMNTTDILRKCTSCGFAVGVFFTVFITIKARNIAIKFYIYIGMILFLLYTICYYYWANISAGGLWEPKGIILPVASVATQTW